MRSINNIRDGKILEPICINCDHTYGYNWPETCKAYPKEIPQEILDCKVDHTKPYKEDNGITFRPSSDVSDEEWMQRLKKL